MEFIDRQAKEPNRVLITPESGSGAYYATIQRADHPTAAGTPLNAATFNKMVAMIRSVALNATIE